MKIFKILLLVFVSYLFIGCSAHQTRPYADEYYYPDKYPYPYNDYGYYPAYYYPTYYAPPSTPVTYTPCRARSESGECNVW